MYHVRWGGGGLYTRFIVTRGYPRTVRKSETHRHYAVDPMLLPSGNPFKCHEEVLYFQLLLIPPTR